MKSGPTSGELLMVEYPTASQGKFLNLIRRFFIDCPPNVEEKNYPTFVPVNFGAVFGTLNHAVWLFIFFFLNVKPLYFFNFISVSMWFSAVLLNRKGFHFASFALISLEILLHQTLCVINIGWSTGFQYWIFIIPIGLFMLPTGRIIFKLVIVLCCFLNFSFLDYLYRTSPPLYNLEPLSLNIINYSNILMFIAFSAFAMFYFAAKMNETKEALWDEQNKVEKAYGLLSKYVAPQLADTISDGQIDLIWKHNRRKLTLFFSDVKDFTRITDSMEPEDMAALLNEYLTEMNLIINAYRGTLAQVIGDALYVFFGAPEITDDKDHAIRCVNMAIDMQRKMKNLNLRWFDRGVDENLQIRCGINTGMATVGGYGSSERKEYTAMGMQVNIAARLEQACEPGNILISHTTWAQIKDEIPCTEKEQIQIKGYHKPVRTYSIQVL
jgi:class 3 adenylate cyclase